MIFYQIDTMIMLITAIKQIILVNNFNFDEKYFICCKKFNENDQIVSIF